MPVCFFDRATSLCLTWCRYDDGIVFDPASLTKVSITREAPVDVRAERWDGAFGVRPATAQELIDYDAAQKSAESTVSFDSNKMLKAVAIWVAQKLGVPLATARNEVLAIYRSLP